MGKRWGISEKTEDGLFLENEVIKLGEERRKKAQGFFWDIVEEDV